MYIPQYVVLKIGETINISVMTIAELNNLKSGDVVYYIANTGTAGIFKYQYLGIFTDTANNEVKHLFISPHFLSTTTILVGREQFSRSIQILFLTEKEVLKKKAQLIKEQTKY